MPQVWVTENTSMPSIDSSMSSKSAIYGRLKRLAQAKVHTFFKQEGTTKLTANGDLVQGLLSTSQHFAVIDSLIAKIISQLRRDLALETNYVVDMDGTVGNSLARAVNTMLSAIFVTLAAKGMSRSQWDSWAESEVEVLGEGWTMEYRQAEVLPDDDLSSGTAIAVPSTDHPNDGLKEAQKADILTLQSALGGAWLSSTANDAKTALLSDHNGGTGDFGVDDIDTSAEYEDKEVPFQMLDINGKPVARHILRLLRKAAPRELMAEESRSAPVNRPPATSDDCGSTTDDPQKPDGGKQLQNHSHKRKSQALSPGAKRRKRDRVNGFSQQVCERCGRLLRRQCDIDAHKKACCGRCNNCQAKNLVRRRENFRHPGTCRSCKEKGLKCEGGSHSHLVAKKSKPCSKCGVSYGANLPRHEKMCSGRCSNCQKAGVPCRGPPLNKLAKGCETCEENGILCDRQFVGAEPVNTSGTPNVCPWCGQSSQSPLLKRRSITLHISLCRGKCSRCDEQGIPCERTHDKDVCKACSESGTGETCLSTVTRPEAKSNASGLTKVCDGCGVGFTASYILLHKRNSCRGKCTRCALLGLACLGYSGLGHASRKSCKTCWLARVDCTWPTKVK